MKSLTLIGYAVGVAGKELTVANGPIILHESIYMQQLHNSAVPFTWHTIIQSQPDLTRSRKPEEEIATVCLRLAVEIKQLILAKKYFVVVGGDHTSAIGTWSGAHQALLDKGPLGLIWLDAHMDSHTPETTESGRVHGMPLASLLGYGFSSLTSILNTQPKLKPEHVCLIGVRSYEAGEAKLLQQLGVRVFTMEEVEARGLSTVFAEAQSIAANNTVAYGVSLDLDVVDPKDMPAVDVPEPNGISALDMKEVLMKIYDDQRCIGVEIVEFDPAHDQNFKSQQLLVSYISILARGY